ncbi:MAG: hypothetical protein LBP60_05055 [Spirochaetaceae bacterium]|jgi:hypothetical protein|nr:hypothetical protein [Spirochaetaceae bacterium]
MRPLKFFLLLLVFLCVAGFALFGQEESEDEEDEGEYIPIESDWSRVKDTQYARGDQVFAMGLGLVKPLFFVDQQRGYQDTNIKLGGLGALGWNYFLSPHLFAGAELSAMFAATLGENMYFCIPIGVRGGYQFIFRRFEFPFSVLVGVAPQTHKERSYFGFFSKAEGAAFFRFNSDWSFGITTSFWWVPQWTSKARVDYDGDVHIHGFFWAFSIGARFHF